jgi:transaldolase
MPPKVINQISTFGKSTKAMTLETVKGFLEDSRKSKFKI